MQEAVEAYQVVAAKKMREELHLICQAEIDAARGNYQQAVAHMKQLAIKKYMIIMHLNQGEIDKRLQEWTKASSTQVG